MELVGQILMVVVTLPGIIFGWVCLVAVIGVMLGKMDDDDE